jgi:hypothetical protein
MDIDELVEKAREARRTRDTANADLNGLRKALLALKDAGVLTREQSIKVGQTFGARGGGRKAAPRRAPGSAT